MSKLKRGRILIIINQRGQYKRRKPKCMKSLETAIGRIGKGPRKGTPKPKECSGAFTKSKSKMKRCKK